MSMIHAGYMAANSRKFMDQYSKTTVGKSTTTNFSEYIKKQQTSPANDEAESVKPESTVWDYKRRHPEDAAHVDMQVSAGKEVRRKMGAGDVDTQAMTMEEYKSYFNTLLDSIPYDVTRRLDETIVSISDEGWEQMQKDPDYEAWILGYFAEDRAVRNPFFGWSGNQGSMIIENFGASIDEHHGVGYSKSSATGSDKTESGDTWWIERHKRMKKIIKEQSLKARKRSARMQEEANEEFHRQQWESRQRLMQFLMPESDAAQRGFTKGHSPFAATVAYESLMDSFGSIFR